MVYVLFYLLPTDRELTTHYQNHQATGLLERFRLNLTSAGLHGGTQHDSSDIRQEMKLLIEVQDISEELDILEMVLRDQHKTMSDLRNILHGKGVPGGENHVLVSHQEWIGRMKEINEKTSKAVTEPQSLPIYSSTQLPATTCS